MNRDGVRLSGVSTTENAHGAGDDAFSQIFGGSFEEKPIWAALYESLRDTVFPPKLPPLELTSTPVPTPDRLAVKTNPWAIGTATVANGGILAIILLMGLGSTISRLPKSTPGDNI